MNIYIYICVFLKCIMLLLKRQFLSFNNLCYVISYVIKKIYCVIKLFILAPINLWYIARKFIY